MTKLRYKRFQALLALLSFIMLAGSFYFQYAKGLQPCPLCIMQRLCVFLLFLICFCATVVKSLRTGMVMACLQFFVAAAGLFFAGRQLWLQSLPPGQEMSCMPELDVLIKYFPIKDVLHSLFWGTKDCAEVSWKWLGITMPGWAALYFVLMLISAIPLFWILSTQRRALIQK